MLFRSIPVPTPSSTTAAPPQETSAKNQVQTSETTDIPLPNTFRMLFDHPEWLKMLKWIDKQNYYQFSLSDTFFSFLWCVAAVSKLVDLIYERFYRNRSKNSQPRRSSRKSEVNMVKKLSELERNDPDPVEILEPEPLSYELENFLPVQQSYEIETLPP